MVLAFCKMLSHIMLHTAGAQPAKITLGLSICEPQATEKYFKPFAVSQMWNTKNKIFVSLIFVLLSSYRFPFTVQSGSLNKEQ